MPDIRYFYKKGQTGPKGRCMYRYIGVSKVNKKIGGRGNTKDERDITEMGEFALFLVICSWCVNA